MGIKPKELNPNSIEAEHKGDVPEISQPLYWDKQKKKILDMIISQDCTIKEIGEKINLTPWKVARYIRDKEFQNRYAALVEANTEQLLGENKRLIQELMRDLKKELKYKIAKLEPNKLLTEYRLLLQSIAAPAQGKSNSGNPKYQQNIFNPQLISDKALKFLEKAALKEQGFKPLEVSAEEIDEVKHGRKIKTNKP